MNAFLSRATAGKHWKHAARRVGCAHKLAPFLMGRGVFGPAILMIRPNPLFQRLRHLGLGRCGAVGDPFVAWRIAAEQSPLLQGLKSIDLSYTDVGFEATRQLRGAG